MLIEVTSEYDNVARSLTKQRPLLNEAFGASESALEKELRTEQFEAQVQDRNYWNPLKRELERLRDMIGVERRMLGRLSTRIRANGHVNGIRATVLEPKSEARSADAG